MTNKQKTIIKYTLAGSVCLNMLMCLNLYHQVGNLEYQTNQLESNIQSTVQQLSHYIWEVRNSSENYSGEFQ